MISHTIGYVAWKREVNWEVYSILIPLVAYIALSCREELGFRGYPLRTLMQPFGLWGALFFAAAIFVLEHIIGGSHWPQAVFGAGAGALLFGMAAIATRGLALPIGMHAAWNLGQWTLGLKGQPGIWHGLVKPGMEDSAELAGMCAYLLVTTAATLAFWTWQYYSTPSHTLRQLRQ